MAQIRRKGLTRKITVLNIFFLMQWGCKYYRDRICKNICRMTINLIFFLTMSQFKKTSRRVRRVRGEYWFKPQRTLRPQRETDPLPLFSFFSTASRNALTSCDGVL